MKELRETLSGTKWKKIGTARRAGVLIPLFSVYSKKSQGIGDLKDLKLAVDWVSNIGASVLQLLPMNWVGYTFCPYDALSSFALEPAYISLGTSANRRPPAGGRVDYVVKADKLRLLREEFADIDASDEGGYRQFLGQTSYWLDDFALFNVMKYHQRDLPWYEWPPEYRDRDASAIELFKKKHRKELDFQKWVQWSAYKQFKDAHRYASSKKVLLKGDLPILISRDSADVWAHRNYFKLDYAAGAPPDMYCAKGQRWGMPTYDWEMIAADGYQYLKEKLKYAENFYDILRVDHVIGLFRIWSISYKEPPDNGGLNGFFDPADEKAWRDHGAGILAVMNDSTDMLLCGEDLGIIPKSCPETLSEFGIPGNDVQRWTKDWTKRHDFLLPEEYRQLSVSMLSTHDTTNWAGWWENEAGTIDEALFDRKASEFRRGIDGASAKKKLFNPKLSRHGRLRWSADVDSVEKLAAALGKKKEEIADFVDMYLNTFCEKEKFWAGAGLKGAMRERCDPEIVKSAFRVTLSSKSIFCIELITDCLYAAGLFKKDPYIYRINTPGTVSPDNWSLVMPVPLEDLVKPAVVKSLKVIVEANRRK